MIDPQRAEFAFPRIANNTGCPWAHLLDPSCAQVWRIAMNSRVESLKLIPRKRLLPLITPDLTPCEQEHFDSNAKPIPVSPELKSI